jgi:hypothetical protein
MYTTLVSENALRITLLTFNRCIDLQTRRVITSRHVTFDETQFPFQSAASDSTPTIAGPATVTDEPVILQQRVIPQPPPPPNLQQHTHNSPLSSEPSAPPPSTTSAAALLSPTA